MRLITKRLFFILLNCFSFTLLSAQTLYWVGGAGNFNDQKHWSLNSGGASSNLIPNSGTDVVFDDLSGHSNVSILFIGKNLAKSFLFLNQSYSLSLLGAESSYLTISGDFVLNERVLPEFQTRLNFSSSSINKSKNFVGFFGRTINSNLNFIQGVWDLSSVVIPANRTAKFIRGNYYLDNTTINVGNFISDSLKVQFYIKKGLVRVKNKFVIGQNTSFATSDTYFDVKKYDAQNYQVNSGVSSFEWTKKLS